MTQKRILIISDAHYGDLAHLDAFGKSGVPTDEDLKVIAVSVAESIDEPVDFLFVLGDLTSRGTPGEFQDFYRFLSILYGQLGLHESQVYLTYGNHDVDWSICNIEAAPQEHHEAYCVAAANVGGFFAPPGDYTHDGPVIGCGVAQLDGIDLISLNSGIECYSDQAIKHGRLGGKQFEWLKNDLQGCLRPNTTKVVILHHHLFSLPYSFPVSDLSVLEEGANVLEVLGACGVDIVLHGHRHHPIVHTASNSGWKKPITFFCAGSFGVSAGHRASGRLPNTFHIASINSNSGGKNLEGYIQTFELNSSSEWIPLVGNITEYPLNDRHWFGAPDAMQKSAGDMGNIVSKLITDLGTKDYARLPEYENLPLSLRSFFYSQLNEMIQDEGVKNDLEITGEYPKTCLATKVVK